MTIIMKHMMSVLIMRTARRRWWSGAEEVEEVEGEVVGVGVAVGVLVVVAERSVVGRRVVGKRVVERWVFVGLVEVERVSE